VQLTGVRLRDGSRITVNPHNPRDCHTITQGRFWVTVRCGATGAVRRIRSKDIVRTRRTTEAGDVWCP
jgi:hypothetical protein